MPRKTKPTTPQKRRGYSRTSVGMYAQSIMQGDSSANDHLKSELNQRVDIAPMYRPYPKEKERKDPVGKNVEHLDYELPPAWGEPAYKLFRVQFNREPRPEHFNWHSGEEWLYTDSGGFQYQFYWPAEPQNPVLDCPLQKGQSIRLFPNCPHRNENLLGPNQFATAWMCIRHLSGSVAPIDRERGEKLAKKRGFGGKVSADSDGPGHSHQNQAKEEELRDDPVRLFWHLTDFPGQLLVARLRSGMTVKQLADRCGVHASYIWKLESGETNLSIDTMALVARHVRVDLTEFTAPPRCFRVKNIHKSDEEISPFQEYRPFLVSEETDEKRAVSKKPFPGGIRHRPLSPGNELCDHWLHPREYELKGGTVIGFKPSSIVESTAERRVSSHRPDILLDSNLGPFGKQSWVVLEGEAVFEGHDPRTGGEGTNYISAHKQPVLHLKNHIQGELRALSDCKLLHVEFSAICSCNVQRIRANEGPKSAPITLNLTERSD